MPALPHADASKQAPAQGAAAGGAGPTSFAGVKSRVGGAAFGAAAGGQENVGRQGGAGQGKQGKAALFSLLGAASGGSQGSGKESGQVDVAKALKSSLLGNGK